MESLSATGSASPSMDEGKVKCSICMEYLADPLTLDCGHIFCKGCISQYCENWEDLGEDLECPLCKSRINNGNFQSNWQLENIAKKIKCLPLNPGKEDVCTRHNEKLHLFCKEDQELLCLICERLPEHQSHTVQLLEEAAKECKDELVNCLENLLKDRERILENKSGTEKESQDLLGQIKDKKTRTVAVFNQLQQFLEEQKTVLLSQLEELEKEIATKRDEHMARLTEELSSLEGLIQQMEEKCQQPVNELIKDIKRTLERYENKQVFENSLAFPLELTRRIRGFQDVKSLLDGVMKKFKQVLKHGANVTLDPKMAHSKLILTEDCKIVTAENIWLNVPGSELPKNPDCFDCWPFVLGCEGFTTGRHFWEVTVGGEGDWAVGVARKSVRRKWFVQFFTPKKGICAVWKWGGQYKIINHPDYTPLSLSQELKRIRVTLDCADGQVSFSDPDTGIHLYSHSGASFCGETLYPFFLVSGEAYMKLSP